MRWRFSDLWGIAIVGGAAFLMAAVAFLRWESEPRSIKSGNPIQLSEGRELYSRYCITCHGQNMEGERGWPARKPSGHSFAPPLDSSGHVANHSDDQLFEMISSGIAGSDMPAFGGALTDDQIEAVLAFIKSNWPEDLRTHQERLSG